MTKKIETQNIASLLWVWRRPTFPQANAVSSARRGLTSLFGMGRGGPPCYSHHVFLSRFSLDMALKENEFYARLSFVVKHSVPLLVFTVLSSGPCP